MRKKKVFRFEVDGLCKINDKYQDLRPEPADDEKNYYEEIISRRKWIEKKVIDILMRETDIDENEVYRIERNAYGRILSYSPYTLYNDTSTGIIECFRYWYRNLSQQMHKATDERYNIEVEINNLIPITDNLVFRFFNFISPYLDHKELLLKYCNIVKIPMLSDRNIKKVKYLIYKWRDVSSNCHYKMTKQEKRKLKKLYTRTTGNSPAYQATRCAGENEYWEIKDNLRQFENTQRSIREWRKEKRYHKSQMKKYPWLYKDYSGYRTICKYNLHDWYDKCVADHEAKKAKEMNENI